MPIVFVVCAFMVLPAGALIGAANAAPVSSSGASTGHASAPPHVAAVTPSSGMNAVSHSSPASPSAKNSFSQASSLPSLGTASTPQQYAKALSQAASKSGSGLSASLNSLAAKIAAGQVSPSSVYLPNLNLLSSGPHTPGQSVGVGYTANPAPMGIGDFGLGVTPYAYNTTHFAGSMTLNAANGTYPGAYYFITPPGATGGSYNSPYYVGIQLNTVTSNIQTPGNNQTSFWTQNVVTINGNWIQFENNVWNFSAGELLPGSILSGNGTYVEPTFYYDYGPSFPLTFPVTINLYNNVSVVNHMDQVTFGYRVVDSKGVFQGIYDTVVFNNVWAPMNPQFAPNFQVSGTYTTPLGLDYDAELIFGGPGGGSNAVFNSINGTETLQYSNQSSGGWKSVPSAYDFGGDTGETAIGVAETWSPGGIVHLQTGPSFLYGLWNSEPQTQVASGSIHYQGTVSPNWAFVFVGDGGPFFNQSYLPTNSTGGFNTYLPPVNGVFPNGGAYYSWGVADGYARDQSTFTATTTGAALTLSLSPGQSTEPLYLNGNAQAEAAAAVLAGWTSGPLVFSDLNLLSGTDGAFYDALFFDHLNDWGFVSFNLFQATGVTDVINVTSLYQGDSLGAANNYYLDGPPLGSPSTLLGIAPALTNTLPQYGELIAFYSDPHVQVYDQQVQGYFGGSPLDPSGYYNLNPAGGAMVLWNTPGAVINETLSIDGSYGAWIAGSPGVTFLNGESGLGANAVSLAGSNDATVQYVVSLFSVTWVNDEGTVVQTPFGVYDAGSIGGTFTDIIAEYGGVGFGDFGGTGAVVNDVQAEGFSNNVSSESIDYFSIGSLLNGATDTSINGTTAYFGSMGVADGAFGVGSFATTITNISAFGSFDYAYGVVLFGSDYTNITNFFAAETVEAAFLEGAQNTTFTNTLIEDDESGVYGFDLNYLTSFNLTVDDAEYGYDIGLVSNVTFTYTNITDVEYGVFIEDAFQTAFTNLNATEADEAGAFLESVVMTTLTNIIGYGTVAVFAEAATTVTATNILATDYIHGPAVELVDGTGATITAVIANEDSIGVELAGFTSATIAGVAASDHSTGVALVSSVDITVSGVTADDNASGAVVQDSLDVTLSGTAATNYSVGDWIDESSSQITDTGASATGGTSTAVFVEDSTFVTVSDVTASATTLTPLYALTTGLPNAAVVTSATEATIVSDVTATNYGAAFFDYGSAGIQVSNINGTSGQYAVVLNDTYNGYFNGIGAYLDFVGLLLTDDAYGNYVTGSSFVDDTSYGVAVLSGGDNTFTMNNFIGNNGATGTYSPAHIQAYSSEGDDADYFYVCTNEYCTTGVGNYWADWHTYGANGYLAPYVVSGFSEDLFPIGPQETFTVNFVATGLPMGTTWSVTLGGVTQSATTAAISFPETMGTYTYGVGSLSGWASTPSSGSVTVTGATYNVSVAFSALVYAVTLSAGGLSADTTWSATVNGNTQSTAGTSLVFYLAAGTYTYAFNNVSGYNLPSTGASGSLTVVSAPLSLATTYSPSTTTSYVSTDTFNTWFAVLIAIAVIALVIALLAVLLFRRREPAATPAPAQAWTPPAGSTTTTPPASGDSGSWSEGPPAGGSPPS